MADFLAKIEPSSTAEFIANKIGRFYRLSVIQKSTDLCRPIESADFIVRLSLALQPRRPDAPGSKHYWSLRRRSSQAIDWCKKRLPGQLQHTATAELPDFRRN